MVASKPFREAFGLRAIDVKKLDFIKGPTSELEPIEGSARKDSCSNHAQRARNR